MDERGWRTTARDVTDDDCVIFEFLMAGLHGGNGAGKRALASHDYELIKEEREEEKVSEGEKEGSCPKLGVLSMPIPFCPPITSSTPLLPHLILS